MIENADVTELLSRDVRDAIIQQLAVLAVSDRDAGRLLLAFTPGHRPSPVRENQYVSPVAWSRLHTFLHKRNFRRWRAIQLGGIHVSPDLRRTDDAGRIVAILLRSHRATSPEKEVLTPAAGPLAQVSRIYDATFSTRFILEVLRLAVYGDVEEMSAERADAGLKEAWTAVGLVFASNQSPLGRCSPPLHSCSWWGEPDIIAAVDDQAGRAE